jgi:predicted acylesterase/phospholipase RssA
VDVQDELRDREALKSATDILVQINNYRTINDMKKKAELTDIYIKPDIEGFTVVSFDEGDKIIESGKNAALANYVALKKIIPPCSNRTYTNQKPNLWIPCICAMLVLQEMKTTPAPI